jgi:hypothetical protein
MSNNNNNNKEMYSETIILNSTNYVNGSGNRFEFKFKGGEVIFGPGSKLALLRTTIYNCVYNISASLGNNTFSIKWINGTVYNAVVKDGYYSISDLNYFIANYLYSNNLYTNDPDNTTDFTSYIFLSADSIAYGSTLVIDVVPSATTASASGITKPSTATWSFPATNKQPEITFCDGLKTLLGLTQQSTYGSQNNTSQSIFYSAYTPVVSTVDSYILTCNMIYNKLSTSYGNVLHSIPLGGSSFGEQIEDNASYGLNYLNIVPNRYSTLVIEVLDQKFQPVKLLDTEVNIMLSIQYPAL